jgi:phage repressor protein C with HTH and peptisase S24 domain
MIEAGVMMHDVAVFATLSKHDVAILERACCSAYGYSIHMLSGWLKAGLAASGTSQASLARDLTERLGRSIDRAAVNKMATGLRKIAGDEMIAIASILQIEPPGSDMPSTDVGQRVQLTTQPQRGGKPDLGVRGIAVGGGEGDGDFRLNGDALQYIERPAGLINRPNAFAVILKNTSMEPVYKHGWPIFVDPDGRKPVDGEDVLVELWGESQHEPGPAFIKTLVGRRGGKVQLKQYNPPPEDLSFQADRVKQILRVIPYVEAMGLSV